LIYQENCFFFSRCDELIDFSTTIPRTHFNQIRKIRISLMLARYSHHTDQSFNHKAFVQLCNILARMTSLEDLFIDFDATYTPCEHDILLTLCKLNVKNFTVVQRRSSNLGTSHKCSFTRALVEMAPYKYECYAWGRLSRVQARESYTEMLYP
jgi:hypothetical protein